MQDGVKFTSYGGIQALCHIQWHRKADGFAATLSGKNQLHLTWDDRFASIEGGTECEGVPAVLALIASDLKPEEYDGSVLIAFEDTEHSIWLAATLANGKPALETEHLFETKTAFLQYISDLPTGGHKRVFHSVSLTDDLNTLLPSAPLREPRLDPRDFVGFKKRSPLMPKSTQQLLVGAAAVSLVVGAGLYGWKWYTTPTVNPQDLIPMASYVEDFSAFSTGCETAFGQSWPTVPGWTLEREGCATQRMQDPLLLPVLKKPAAAFKVFTLNPKHNEILSSRAAEVVYANWPHSTHVTNGKLLVYKPFDVGLKPYDPDQASKSTTLKYRIEDAFVGIEESIEQTDAGILAIVKVSTSAALGEVLRRIETLEGGSLKSLERTNGKINLTFRDVDIIKRVAPEPEKDAPA